MKPVLTVVTDDAELRALLERDLRERFGGHYGSVKRVASAVGAGSIAVQLAHLRLAELGEAGGEL